MKLIKKIKGNFKEKTKESVYSTALRCEKGKMRRIRVYNAPEEKEEPKRTFEPNPDIKNASALVRMIRISKGDTVQRKTILLHTAGVLAINSILVEEENILKRVINKESKKLRATRKFKDDEIFESDVDDSERKKHLINRWV